MRSVVRLWMLTPSCRVNTRRESFIRGSSVFFVMDVADSQGTEVLKSSDAAPKSGEVAKSSGERKFKIVFDRKSCIGAGACAAVAPDFWVMQDDGKADLVGFSVDEKGRQVLLVPESQLTPDGRQVIDLNKEAAEVCPVQVIHIYDADTNEKII